MLYTFAVSNMFHNLHSGITYHKVTFIRAHSKPEAEGIELNTLLAEYPVSQGWTGHSTNALQVPVVVI